MILVSAMYITAGVRVSDTTVRGIFAESGITMDLLLAGVNAVGPALELVLAHPR